jgi:hypothetical protein
MPLTMRGKEKQAINISLVRSIFNNKTEKKLDILIHI